MARARIALAFVAGLLASSGDAAPSGASDRALGQYLSSECVTCHQLSGRFDGIPPIVGLPEDSFVAIMKEYKNKHRANPVMQTIASNLSAEEIAALAAYFGSLPPAQPAKKQRD